jgi:hypothetical protein
MYTGITGAIEITNLLRQPTKLAYVSGWNVENSTEMVEVTEFSSVDKKVLPCSRSWRASADGTISFETTNGQQILFDAMNKGRKMLFYFYLNHSENDKENTFFCGEGFIESLSVNLSAEDVGKVSISVVGNDKLALYINNQDVTTEYIHIPEKFDFSIGKDGHLYANVPEKFKDNVWLNDEDGHLYVKL